MSNPPDLPGEDPFGELPPELRQMLEQLGGPDALAQVQRQVEAMMAGGANPLAAMFGGGQAPTGPVDWDLATRVALQVAADDDRAPDADEERRAADALQLAEHWLDATPLPAPPDAGRVVVGSRQTWVNAAVGAMAPLVDPVARAATDAMVALAREQLDELGSGDVELPPELAPMQGLLGSLLGGEGGAGPDLGAMFRPAGAMMAGLQAGQVLGQLARTLLTQYELGIPTAPRAEAHLLAVNVADAFDGWDIDPTEVAIVLALHEAALRRLYHAVPWLEAHVHALVARFASGTVLDAARMQDLSRELMEGVDPDDPESLQHAMQRAASFRIEPTDDQRRILERLQGVVCLVGAWARHEVARASEGRVPSLPRIAEVLRRRRAERGDGDDLLAALLGLDLKPDDETVGERFVVAVEAALGPEGLRATLEHPENLPDARELADPEAWLLRTRELASDVPDDVSTLFGELGDAPHEASAEERLADRDRGPGEGDDRGANGDDDGPTDDGARG
ncbi:zinc-dependent metalloprotease [Nitriliruptoraceae bacterium ZYF776]|nr:zinc-dependent metalloprotease [Profundirhabdus halotolerans]